MGELTGFPPGDPGTLVALSIIGGCTIIGLSIVGGLLILAFVQNQPQSISTSYARDDDGNVSGSQVNIT
jgi:hypothetical protein